MTHLIAFSMGSAAGWVNLGYPKPPDDWARTSPETPNIVHPLFRQWVGGSPMATKLAATLTPADMRQDVWLDWAFFREEDSPGNYTFRETSGALGYVTYDAQGADHVLGWLPR